MHHGWQGGVLPPYVPTHWSMQDGSDVMLIRDYGDGTATAENENGDRFKINLEFWEPLTNA